MDVIEVGRRPTRPGEALVRAVGSTLSSPLVMLLAVITGFGISYAQYPLYYLAQNEYFFYALAARGEEFLRSDWLAGTADPWPVFTRVVQWTLEYLDPRAFYIYFLVFTALYAYSLFGIVRRHVDLTRSRTQLLAFAAAFTLLHSAALTLVVRSLVGINVRTGILEGVASQRILWDMFQPGVFGVFLLLSIQQFLHGRSTAAVVLSSLAAVFHPSYLISAGALTIAYMIILSRRKTGVWAILGLGALAFAIVLPAIAHTYSVFRPSSPEVGAQAREVLAQFRLARHTDVGRWFDTTAAVKVVAILGALILTRRSALFWILLLPAGVGAILTFAHLLTGSEALALLFPWRVSVFLVPLANSLLLASAVSFVFMRPRFQSSAVSRLVSALSLAVLVACTAAGAVVTQQRFSSWTGLENRAVLAVVGRAKAPGHTYLVPPRWRNFRLQTGAPTYVDYWFIPYNDVAVIEWDRRLRLAEAYYRARGSVRCELATGLAASPNVTHIVERRTEWARCPGWTPVFDDAGYVLSTRLP